MKMDISAVIKAFCKAQAEMVSPKKDGTNPHFKSNYATLQAVNAAILPVLANNGLAYSQDPTPHIVDQKLVPGIKLYLYHESGEVLEFGPILVPSKDCSDPQKVKSGYTYMRRTQLLAVFGLSEEDDDGNEAAQKPAAPKDEKRNPPKDNEKRVIAYIERIEQAETQEALDNIASDLKKTKLSQGDKAELGRIWKARRDKING